MSIRSITVQYVGNVLFLPKLERDVKLVIERDYGTANPDRQFVMERTCLNADDDKTDAWFMCSECECHALIEYMGGGFGVPRYCPNCGAKVVDE